MRNLTRAFCAWAIAVLFAAAGVDTTSAQESAVAEREVVPLTADQEALALAVSQVCANEAFGHRADCLLVLQTVRTHGDTPAEQLSWVRLHSQCIFGDEEPVERSGRPVGNCPWTRHLTDSDDRPEGWPTNPDWRWEPWTDSSGREHGGSVERWRLTRGLVRAMIADWHTPRGGWPCSVDPQTWGGRRLDAGHVARHPHVYQALHCRDPLTGLPTLNEGFRYRPDAFRARPVAGQE